MPIDMTNMSPRNPASDAMVVDGNLVSLLWKISYCLFSFILKSILFKKSWLSFLRRVKVGSMNGFIPSNTFANYEKLKEG